MECDGVANGKVLEAVVPGPAAEIEVVLQWHADERRHGIVQFLGQLGHVVAGGVFSCANTVCPRTVVNATKMRRRRDCFMNRS